MEWLSRWWKELLREWVLTGAGLTVIGSQVLAAQPKPILCGVGLALTLPATYYKIREIIAVPGPGGSSGPSSLPPGPEASPLSSGSTDE